jgi:6-phosphogluconolactonase
MSIIIVPDSHSLARKGATIFSRLGQASVSLRGRFIIALSGGTTPRFMHRLLAEAPYVSTMPWNNTHIFWVDERCVPADDPASNYGRARADLLSRVPIPNNQVHQMPVGLDPGEGAAAYQQELIQAFQSLPWETPVFDLIFLGIGTDGHTASLFPGQEALTEKERLVVSVKGGNPDVNRITMTLPLINHAKEIVFMVAGKEKAIILKDILEGPSNRFPAQMVQPLFGGLTWLVDEDAASMLPSVRGTHVTKTASPVD